MRICIISTPVFPCPPPGYSGLEMITWLRAKGLAERGHQVSLVAPEGSSCPGAEIIPIGKPGGWDEKAAYQSYWKELLRFDVVVDDSWMKWSYLLKGEGVLKAPVLGVTHAPINTMYSTLPPNVDRPCFVCISRDQQQHFEAFHGRAARWVYNGVDVDAYRPLENMARTDRFLFLARFSSIKGPDLAIAACAAVGVGLDLVGDTSITNEPAYLEQCRKACDGERLRLVGPAKRGECVWWMSRAHCFLHPNKRFREPMGLAPVEAQLTGLPVIAWRYGALRETVLDGETGRLVDSEGELLEAVRELSGPIDDAVRRRCRDWASQFSVQAMVDGYERLCVEAVETGGW